jgi:ArsR family transcriptional regulator
MKPVARITDSCAPCGDAPLDAAQAEALAGALRVLADPARLRLLSLIASQEDGACGCDLTDPLGITQPTISHHLKVLHDAGLVTRSKRGVWVCYQVAPEGLSALADVLASMVPAQRSRPGKASVRSSA